MKYTARTDWPRDESRWSAAARRARHNRATVDLTETNPTFCRFRSLRAALKPLAKPENLWYEPDSCGLPAARRAIGDYYLDRNARIPPDRILLTAGTSEAYAFLLKLLVGPGQSVMVPEPGYPLLDHLAQLSDAHLVRYPLAYDETGGWSIDRRAFEERLTSAVRAVVVVHPNNPTGHWTLGGEREWLTDLVRDRGAALIADEVFLDYAFEEKHKARTFAENDGALTFTLSGVSKVIGLPQMKLSWIACTGLEDETREAMARLTLIADAFLSVSGPPQRALPAWLAAEPLHAVQDEIRSRVRHNRRMLEKSLVEWPARLLKADGGWSAVVRTDLPQTDEEFSLTLMEKGVLVLPGFLFDLPEHHLVISLLPEPSVFDEGLARMSGGFAVV